MARNPAAHVSIYKDTERCTDEEVAKTRDETASKSVGLERPPPTHTHRALRAASPATPWS